MSTSTISDKSSEFAAPDFDSGSTNLNEQFLSFLKPFASLRLTVVLFAMAIFIILAGTLAQVNKDIWVVIDEYFRTGIARIEFKVFFPPSFFPNLDHENIPGYFYFPGGWLIGFLMSINLLSAHLIRFKVQAKGNQQAIGWAVIVIGLLIGWVVIASGSNKEGFQDSPLLSWRLLWVLIEVSMGALVVGGIWAFIKLSPVLKTERWLVAGGTLLTTGLLTWFLSQGEAARFSDSSMRILWQLIKATFVGLVLLQGCIVLFKKRAGVVLLHGGVALMMLSELIVGMLAIETQMTITEGDTANFVHDIREIELAVIDETDPEQDEVTVIPKSILLAKQKEVVSDPKLPFDYELVKYYPNSSLRKISSLTPEEKEQAENPATAGIGTEWIALETRSAAGTDTGGSIDTPAAYIKIIDKKTNKSLGVYLVNLQMALQEISEQVDVDGKPYQLYLRFKRTYKPYTVTLVDVRKDDYTGTDTVRNYSSDIKLVNPITNVDRDIKIRMNDPLRYSGETFYQSGYYADPRTGQETTTLSVVTNLGWMIPYVSCMVVVVGMFYHFMITLLRFLGRREKQAIAASAVNQSIPQSDDEDADRIKTKRLTDQLITYLIPVFILIVFGGYLTKKALIPKTSATEMNLYEFGELPILYEGRTKPIDTFARNNLRLISGRQDFEEYTDTDQDTDNTDTDKEKEKEGEKNEQKKQDAKSKKNKKQPAIKWLLDTLAKPDEARKYPVFRIDNPELRQTLGLKKRPGLRYSVDEISEKLDELAKQADLARKAGKGNTSIYQSQVLKLERKIGILSLINFSCTSPNIPPNIQTLERDIKFVLEGLSRFESRRNPPRFIPLEMGENGNEKIEWQTYAYAWTFDLQNVVNAYRSDDVKANLALAEKQNEATQFWKRILEAYSKNQVAEFNNEVRNYKKWLKKHQAELPDTNLNKIDFEAFFNHFEPFYYCAALYLIAFVLACISFLFWTKPLGNAAFWLIVLTFVVHTLALVGRIYISGRPPVTNLYSSAVFIGWGAVVAGILIERLNNLGIGNLLAGVAGFSTLVIAHMLSGDGDTFTVLQAVLDTQFWLTTHVVCITLGYAATFAAGLLGLFYILWGIFTPRMTAEAGKEVVRMLYGVLCFAIILSFFGTVLGGLWADDSWGRFWGWDPKENGALIIVLWNALVLHARWGGLVKDRGLAILSIGGNIVTSWSWFGVNELGVGLHSYGFTEGVLLALGLFVLSQLAIIALALIPQKYWWSFRKRDV